MLLFGADAIKEICIFLRINRSGNLYAHLPYLQFGTFDYNKVAFIKR